VDKIESLDDALSAIEQIGQDLMKQCRTVPASSCGLDDRCGTLFVGDTFIMTKAPSRLDYYGGFEYIEAHDKFQIGDYTVYTNESGRVQDALEALEEFEINHQED